MRQRLYFRDIVSSATGFTTGVSKSLALPGGPVLGRVFDPTDTALHAVSTFGGALAPRTLSPTRGTGGNGSYAGDGTAADLPMNTPTAAYTGTNIVWRGLLTHFITDPFPVARAIPAQVMPFGYFSEHTDTVAQMYVALSVYAVDATGAVVDYLRDIDTAVGGGDGLNYSGNRLVYVPITAGIVPAGGRLVIEVFYGFEMTATPSGVQVHFRCDGWNDNIPPVATAAEVLNLELLAETCATYVDIDGLTAGTVFDALQDPAAALTVHQAWTTSILPAGDGGEQRSQFRLTPDEVLEFGVVALDSVEAARIEALLRTNDEGGYRLPWWPDAQDMTADFVAGSSVLPINTVGVDIVAGGEILFYQRPGAWELATVLSVDSASQITLTANTAATWKEGSRIIPIKRAVLVPDHDVSRAGSFIARAPLQFRVVA